MIEDALKDFPRWWEWIGKVYRGFKPEASRRVKLLLLYYELNRMMELIEKEINDGRRDG